MRLTLTKWHIWLGWLAGVPLLIWTISGLFMVARPIEEVRGTHLRAETPAVMLGEVPPVFPRIDSAVRAVESVDLVQRSGGPIWVIRFADGGGRRASVETGAYLAPQLTSEEAATIALAAYAGDEPLAEMRRFDADANPLDLRRGRPAWRARFGTSHHVYIDAETGDVLAIRTGLWRAFDFMWGLHIMDLQQREDTHHLILVVSAILALLMVLLGLIILPWRYIKKRRKERA
ncbi:PepSY domain-containing protein [Parasphingopyxis marina]|uniref:PepSY domain-containing protein n=1 Tax=Parasphingopyxis marina TaxID=2761622 RepID=A0A842I258_9SPHN|nr:PepSY domain-containing protein [Parasphingopyxis marina]MBC2778789.1 PepSY domain-containing protein [Parasphingopyxis marina]